MRNGGAQRKEAGEGQKARPREVLDLAHDAYEHEMNLKPDARGKMDLALRKIAIHNIKGFLFAGSVSYPT
jgi:hypothetical protein